MNVTALAAPGHERDEIKLVIFYVKPHTCDNTIPPCPIFHSRRSELVGFPSVCVTSTLLHFDFLSDSTSSSVVV